MLFSTFEVQTWFCIDFWILKVYKIEKYLEKNQGKVRENLNWRMSDNLVCEF